MKFRKIINKIIKITLVNTLLIIIHPPLDFFHPFFILLDLTFDKVITVFAVAKAVADHQDRLRWSLLC